MSGKSKYAIERANARLRNGPRTGLNENPDINHYKEQLAKAQQRLAAEEKVGDAKRINKALDIVNNLESTIKRMEARSK